MKKKPFYKKWWVWLIAIIVIGVVGNSQVAEEPTQEVVADEVATPAEDVVEEVEVEPAPEPEPVQEEPDVPREYSAALVSATSYSEMMHMSKKGIYDQLVSEYGEKFPAEAAQYAIDNMSADWNENALEQGKSYANSMFMSKQGVYDQLISEYGEQFTAEEAQYAIDNLNIDWKENALKKARTYVDEMAMSNAAVYDQLISEYGEKFTAEEAQYAVDNL